MEQPPAARTSVRFVPRSAALHLRFAAHDSTGTLVLTHAAGAEVSLQVEGTAGPAPIVVLPDGAEVRNAAARDGAGRATYRVAVPDGVATVRIDVAGRTRAVVRDLPAAPDSLVLRLAAPPGDRGGG